jgi:PilZ domain
MRFGMGVPKESKNPRRETRVPMEVGVHISGNQVLPGTETTFTENVSAKGARVRSTRRWKTGDKLTLATMTGSFRSIARVAYCQATSSASFAVGLEFLEARGQWVVAESMAS